MVASHSRAADSSKARRQPADRHVEPADDLEHVGGRGLPLERLELVGARLHLVEQPHVLDRDHRLVGKGLDQLDLLGGKRPHLGARQA